MDRVPMFPTTIVLDMGNVIVKFSHARMCEQIGILVGVGAEPVRRLLFDQGWQWELERGSLSNGEFAARLERKFGCVIPRQALEHAAGDIFSPVAGISEFLADLKQTDVRLMLLSNTCRAHLDWIQSQWDFLSYFDDLVLSYEEGVMKPERKIFEVLVARAQADPTTLFFTDDIPENVAASRAFGIDAEVFIDVPTLRRHLSERGLPLPSSVATPRKIAG